MEKKNEKVADATKQEGTKTQNQVKNLEIDVNGTVCKVPFVEKDGIRYADHKTLVQIAHETFMGCEFPQQTYADGKIVTICIVTNDLGIRSYGVGSGSDGQAAANQAFDRAVLTLLAPNIKASAGEKAVFKSQYDFEKPKKETGADEEALQKANEKNKVLQEKVNVMEQEQKTQDEKLKAADAKAAEAAAAKEKAESEKAELAKKCDEQEAKLQEAEKHTKEVTAKFKDVQAELENFVTEKAEEKANLEEKVSSMENKLKTVTEQKQAADRKVQEAEEAAKKAEDELAAVRNASEADGNTIRQEREAREKAEAEKNALEQICNKHKAELEKATSEIAALKEAKAADEAALKEASEGRSHAEAALEALRSEAFEAKRQADQERAMEAKRQAAATAEPAAETNNTPVQETKTDESNSHAQNVNDAVSMQADAEQDMSDQETIEDVATSDTVDETVADDAEDGNKEIADVQADNDALEEDQADDKDTDAECTVTNVESAQDVTESTDTDPATPAEPVNKEGYWFEHLPEWEIPQSLTPENPDDILLKEAVFNPNKKAPDDAPDETRMYRPGPKYISQLLKYREVHARSIVRLGTKSNIAATRNIANAIVRYLKSQHILLDCTDDPALAIVLDQNGVPHK